MYWVGERYIICHKAKQIYRYVVENAGKRFYYVIFIVWLSRTKNSLFIITFVASFNLGGPNLFFLSRLIFSGSVDSSDTGIFGA